MCLVSSGCESFTLTAGGTTVGVMLWPRYCPGAERARGRAFVSPAMVVPGKEARDSHIRLPIHRLRSLHVIHNVSEVELEP